MKAIFKHAELKIYHIFLFVACLISSPQAFQVDRQASFSVIANAHTQLNI